MIDEVRLSWGALLADGAPMSGIAVRLLQIPQGTSAVFLGIDAERNHHLLMESTAADEMLDATLASVTITPRELVIEGLRRSMTDVACLDGRLADVFDHFVVALIDRLRRSDAPAGATARNLLQEWRRFLETGPVPPGPSVCAALVAELLVLRELIDRDAGRRVDVWTGPFGARHDLRRGQDAIEVKATRSHEAMEITVHGIDQLQEPPGGTLTLSFVRLEHVPGGALSLPGLLDDLIDRGTAAADLYARVAAAGVTPADLSGAAETTFELREWTNFDVAADFPRILAESFVDGELPAGTSELTYRVDLNHAGARRLDAEQLEARLTRMATGVGV